MSRRFHCEQTGASDALAALVKHVVALGGSTWQRSNRRQDFAKTTIMGDRDFGTLTLISPCHGLGTAGLAMREATRGSYSEQRVSGNVVSYFLTVLDRSRCVFFDACSWCSGMSFVDSCRLARFICRWVNVMSCTFSLVFLASASPGVPDGHARRRALLRARGDVR